MTHCMQRALRYKTVNRSYYLWMFLMRKTSKRCPSTFHNTYQGHLDLRPGNVGHRGCRLQQRRGEEEVVVARGCQVQGHCDVEGQREDWEVPLAEDGAQGTGEDGADGRSTRGPVKQASDPNTRWSGSRMLSVSSWRPSA